MADFRLWHVEQVFAALALRISARVLATVASRRRQVLVQRGLAASGRLERSHCGVDFDHVSLLGRTARCDLKSLDHTGRKRRTLQLRRRSVGLLLFGT